MAGKGKAKNITGKARNEQVHEVGSLDFWRNLARNIAPEEQDEWRISEIATILNDQAKLLGAHWQSINTILHGNTDKKIAIGFSITLDRSEDPPEVAVKISFNQKFGQSLSGQVPDPDQTELPLHTSSEVPEPEQDEAA